MVKYMDGYMEQDMEYYILMMTVLSSELQI